MTQRINNVSGHITKYFNNKGYGFVNVYDLHNLDKNEVTSVFIHITDVESRTHLEEGWKLKFDACKTKKGWKAENARFVRGRKDGAKNTRKPWERVVDDTRYSNRQNSGKVKKKKTSSASGYRWVGDKLVRRDE